MEKIILSGVEIQFNELPEEMQEYFYRKYKEILKNEVIQSKYFKVRRLLIVDKHTESNILEKLFEIEMGENGSASNVELIWNHINFEKSDEKRLRLANSKDWALQSIVIEDEELSSEMLNKFLCEELQSGANGGASEFRLEIILNNRSCKMNQETFWLFANSNYEQHRKLAGQWNKESVLLNELLRKELKNQGCISVIDTCLLNEYFEMEEETLEVLAKSDDTANREIAVKSKKATSEFLNRILRDEVESIGACNVIKECMKNENFQMEEETLYVIEKEHDYDALTILAEDPNASQEWLEKIYLRETDREVLEAAELNLLQKLHKSSTTLNAVQKRKVLGVLKELKRSRKKQPLTKYLEEILEIIG